MNVRHPMSVLHSFTINIFTIKWTYGFFILMRRFNQKLAQI